MIVLSVFYYYVQSQIIIKSIIIITMHNFRRQQFLVSWTRPLPSPALDVLHHQRGEGRVWPLLQGFRGTEQNVDMTNEIRVVTCIANYRAPQIP